jgi:adenine-specific DNA-methyltransferase
MNKRLEDYTKEELLEVVKGLKRRKKFLEEVPERAIKKGQSEVTNLIIEGDNYHSLSVLNYTHAGKVDVIYMDPPYNTGSTDWKYNNDYVDAEDAFRHSKWASFMNRRLKLAANLLTKDGILVVTIDNYEVHNLRHLMEENLPDRDFVITIIEHNHRGRAKSNFALTHEYAIWAIPRGKDLITRKKEYADDAILNLRRTGQNSLRKDRPNMFYGVLVNRKTLEIIGTTDPLLGKYNVSELNSNSELELVLPIDKDGTERRWYYGKERLLSEAKTGGALARSVRGRIEIYFKFAGKPIRRKSVWTGPQYDSSSHGTVLLNKILGRDAFSYPKSIWAVKECLEAASDKNDAIILDCFAGSGTTGHAALLMNQEDGGSRSFILCTNNENQIAQEVTYPRIKSVIDGYSEAEGIPANLRYFKTKFVDRQRCDDQTRIELVARSTEMICLRENAFEVVSNLEGYRLFAGNKHYAAIVFEPESIHEIKSELSRLNDNKPVHIYVFSLSNDTYESDFADLERKHELRPIPESILEVYRRIFLDPHVKMEAWND